MILSYKQYKLNEEVDYFIGEKLNSHKLRGNAYISLLRIGKHWIY